MATTAKPATFGWIALAVTIIAVAAIACAWLSVGLVTPNRLAPFLAKSRHE